MQKLQIIEPSPADLEAPLDGRNKGGVLASVARLSLLTDQNERLSREALAYVANAKGLADLGRFSREETRAISDVVVKLYDLLAVLKQHGPTLKGVKDREHQLLLALQREEP